MNHRHPGSGSDSEPPKGVSNLYVGAVFSKENINNKINIEKMLSCVVCCFCAMSALQYRLSSPVLQEESPVHEI